MKKSIFILSSLPLMYTRVAAQVDDVSLTLQPNVSYNWFDKKTTVEDGLMYGLQAGFSFGGNVELTALWERSADLKQRFGAYEEDIDNVIPGFRFQNRSVMVNRYGGQLRFNIPAKSFAPYLLIGTGVQNYERELSDGTAFKSGNLYGLGGLGLKLNMGARATFNIEGRGMAHNMNPASLLYNPTGSSQFDDWINNQERQRMFNWALNAGLQFYLGGTNYGNMSSIDRAYYRKYTSGMSGAKFTIAPAGAYVDLNKQSAFKSAYFIGGELGVDFTDFIGLKGYYLRAVNPDADQFEVDDLAMFGLDFVGKLNVSRGIVPFVTVGGGYLNVMDGYKGRRLDILPIYQTATSSYYAKGGAGVEIPVANKIDLYAAANIFYTTKQDERKVADLVSTKELAQHMMYQAGIKIKLGSNADPYAAINRTFENRYTPERAVYERQIKELEKELITAYQNNDTLKIKEIVSEKAKIDQQKENGHLIRMSPAELEGLIDKVIDGVENEQTPNIENRLQRLEELLINLNQNSLETSTPVTTNAISYNTPNEAVNNRLINEINNLKQQINQQNAALDHLRQQTNVNNNTPAVTSQVIAAPNQSTVVVATPANSNDRVEGVILNKGLSAFIGTNFGDATTFNLGIRGNYGFSTTPIIFMPEVYVGLGETNGFGISANAIYPISVANSKFSPYFGLGLGLNIFGKSTSFNPNFIGGVAHQMGKGALFADYTVRGAFRNNQIALGYRFRF
jgi:hypothetical protein